ncbi:glutathione S-transferase [Ceratobasidium sp. AG-Ba]|nr:glutathione S-transferase [Ceratobasidium sp. AG-Ba]
MPIKIYGALFMANVRRVLVVCEELGLEYELIEKYGDTKSPFGHVPVLIDTNGFKLYESRAICRYLVNKYGRSSNLVPDSSDVERNALFEQAASIEYSKFEPPGIVIAWEMDLAKKFGFPSDEGEARKYQEIVKESMQGYERILSEHQYLAGDTLTLADLWHLPYGEYIENLVPEVLTTQPSVQRQDS